MSDQRLINAGIADALQEGRPIDDLTARIIASAWHGGQFAALYALASTGALDLYSDDREDNSSAEEEIQHEMRIAQDEMRIATGGSAIHLPELVALYVYCTDRQDRGPVPGWSNLHF